MSRPLLLDCGNSSCKYRFGERSGRLADVNEVLECVRRFAPSEVVVSSVSRLGADIQDRLQGSGVPVLNLAVVDGLLGLRLVYAEPQRLGVDRWLTMLALLERGRPVVIIDAGTALTIDVLSADRNHLGGYILPGLALMRRALVDDTFALPPVSQPGQLVPGTSTAECIANGSVLALIGAVESALAQSPVAAADVIWTGGDAAALRNLSAWPGEHHPQLIFEGMMTAIADPAYRASLV
ncbi:type III pantothenate kinase [Saccharospirillum mangrovi]|uniref:type III pantothenate kinase n=1 Tax=Saccharospirillum mangrovi TaxID=2161747 RepID=UPI0013007550|nr:type III pantothenate kinase [Saccharospirillum mangrovi]